MRVVILTMGSRGDVEPALALAWRLRAHGHEVSVSVPVNLLGFAREAGIDAKPVSIDTRDFLESPEGQRFLAAGNSREYVRLLIAKRREVISAVQADLIAAVRGADFVVATRLIEEEGSSLAEWLGVPFAALHFFPARSNSSYPSPFVTTRRLPPALTRLTYQVVERRQWHHAAPDLNRMRSRLDLPPADAPAAVRDARSGSVEIQVYSRFLTPGLTGWGPQRPLVGALRMEPEQRALIRTEAGDPELDRWLAAGEPPAYVGFGSQPVPDGRRFVDDVRRTAEALNMRILLNAGWTELLPDDADDRLLIRHSVNHDDVLPRCRVAVHHGGSGSTAASVGAGLPTVICADFADRAFWGQAVARLGIGATFRMTQFSSDRLTDAIAPLLDKSTTRRVREVAAHMADEDALTRSADIITSAAGRKRSSVAP